MLNLLLIFFIFLFYYERDLITSLSDNKKDKISQAFKATSRYLDDLWNIGSPYFKGMVGRIYPPELQLNKTNASDKPHVYSHIHLFQTDWFHQKFMISPMTLILSVILWSIQ